jgi:hypothetical protein
MNSEIAVRDFAAMAATQGASPAPALPSGVSSPDFPAAPAKAAGIFLAGKRLPDRRRSFRVRAAWTGSGTDLFFFVDIGVDAAGQVGEIFIVAATGKVGSLLALVAHDVAVSLSHFLRLGVTLEQLHARYAAGSLAQWACVQALELRAVLLAEGAI